MDQRKKAYYKKLRKVQKKRWQKKKHLESLEQRHQEEINRLREEIQRKQSGHEEKSSERKKKRARYDEQITISESKGADGEKAEVPATVHGQGIKELDASNVVKTGKFIGSGTFGTCQLAIYRGIDVVVKEFKLSGKSMAQEVLSEAKVLSQLGDHPGLPLLFGVQTKEEPCKLILQFHGHKEQSITLLKAIRSKKLDNEEWLGIVDLIGKALKHIHVQGFLHNDLKGDNIVLEKRSHLFNPVIIDFGKSAPITAKCANKKLSAEEQKVYSRKYPHIAPEIVDGTGVKTIQSDIYSFAKIIEKLCVSANLNLQTPIRVKFYHLALSKKPSKRPSITELIRN